MTKRRRPTSDTPGEELADINEQELAKDGTPERPSHRQETGRDTDKNVSLPESMSKEDKEEKPQVKSETEKEHEKEVEKPEILPVTCEIPEKPVRSEAPRQEPPDTDEPPTPHTEPQKEEPPDEDIPDIPVRIRGGGIYVAVILLCLAASIVMLLFAALGRSDEDIGEAQTLDIDTEQSGTPSVPENGKMSAGEIYAERVGSTVSVVCTKDGEERYYSGFAIFEGGYVATLYEAAEGDRLEIVSADGKRYPADIIGSDASVNLALLRTDAQLECVGTAELSSVEVGQSVFAIGNLGSDQYASSLLVGEVAYLERQSSLRFPDGIERKVNALQLGALGGNIGGCPVFNANGEVVAMSLSQTVDGACLAFPMERAMPVFSAMKDGKALDASVLCALAFAPPELGILGEQAESEGIYGVRVMGFSSDGCDAAAKLRIGDIIYKIDSTPIADTQTLKGLCESRRAGETLEVYVIRNSQKLSFFVALTEKL